MKNTRIILTLLGSFILVMSVLLWHFSRLQSDLINSTALRTAELYSIALMQFRSVYTSEVVATAKKNGLDVTHDYTEHNNAIPLPTTLSIMLGKQIGKHANGASASVYSPFPFPWREQKTELAADNFELDAWNFLVNNPEASFSRYEESQNGAILRYAVADVMQSQCVACHNSHPASPRHDWKSGDVRGVLAINLPLGSIVSQTSDSLRSTSLIYFSIGLGIVFIIGTVITKLTQQSQILRDRIANRTIELEMEITERRHAMEALADTEGQNRLLLNSVGDGIYGLDLEGKTTFVNPAACTMLGYTAQELMGQPMHTLIHHSYPDGTDYPRENCPMYSAFTDGEVHRVEDEVLWRKDGSSFPVAYTSTPMERDREIIGAVVVFTDISGRKKVEKMKDEFVSTVSHELRTPLTSIMGSLGLIVGGRFGNLPDKAQHMLSIAYENSERLALLINDLLYINKLQSSGTQLKMSPLSVRTLVDDATLAILGYADKYHVQLDWQSGDADNACINGDENRLIQVLSNLLSNAIKYSPKGARVKVFTSYSDNHVRISVSDNGPGIPEEYQGRIFEKFTQADSSDTRQQGGTGLGLAISKEIIAQHDGHIGFDSVPAKGTTFYFELPLIKT